MNHLRLSEIKIDDKVSFTEKITIEKVKAFTELTGDINPLHVNDEYAKGRGYDSIVVHGLLSTSFFSKMAGVYLPGERSLLMGVNVEFLKPVFPGDELTFEAVVKEIDENFNYITTKIQVLNQHSQKVIRGQMKVGVYEK